jgi:hypothetical protein
MKANLPQGSIEPLMVGHPGGSNRGSAILSCA